MTITFQLFIWTKFLLCIAPESINCNFEHVNLCGYVIDESTAVKWKRVNTNLNTAPTAPIGGKLLIHALDECFISQNENFIYSFICFCLTLANFFAS